MGPDDQKPSRDKLLHNPLEDVPLQRFVKVGENKVAAEYEVEWAIGHLFANVPLKKFNVLFEGLSDRAELFRTGEGCLDQFFRKVPKTTWPIPAIPGTLKDGMINVGRDDPERRIGMEERDDKSLPDDLQGVGLLT